MEKRIVKLNVNWTKDKIKLRNFEISFVEMRIYFADVI